MYLLELLDDYIGDSVSMYAPIGTYVYTISIYNIGVLTLNLQLNNSVLIPALSYKI